jgi:hypothetical protein
VVRAFIDMMPIGVPALPSVDLRQDVSDSAKAATAKAEANGRECMSESGRVSRA